MEDSTNGGQAANLEEQQIVVQSSENDDTTTDDTTNTDEIVVKYEDSITISAEDLLNRKIESIPCLVEPFLQKVGLACLGGSSDTGKSSLLRYLCMCIVSGKSDFLGFTLNAEYNRAIYVSTEDDADAMAFLLGMQNKDLKEEHQNLRGLRYIFDTKNLVNKLDTALTEVPADIVCIDAFSDLFGGNPNLSNEVRTFLQEYHNLAQKHKCLILFLHHTGKRKEESAPSKHNLLGSQGFEAKMRLVMELKSDVVDINLKHLCIVKGNYLPAIEKSESYALRFTENMTFENTDERVPLEALMKATEAGKEKYERIKELRAQRLTFEEIAPMVGYKTKSAVSKFIKGYEEKYGISKPLPTEPQADEQEAGFEELHIEVLQQRETEE